MKRYITIAALAVAASASAQGVFDALKYADNDILGTARYSSMAGAFGALGGDISAVGDNPAGLGIYRWSEAMFTANLAYTGTQATWDMTKQTERYDFRVNTASFVWSFTDREKESGWISNNIAFNYTRLKNFNRSYEMRGAESLNSMTDYMAGFTDGFADATLADKNAYKNVNVPYISELAYQSWLINPGTGADSLKWHSVLNEGEKSQARYRAVESGYINEYQFSYGANISNVFYWGVSFGLQNIDYKLSSNYAETFAESGDFSLKNTFRTTGLGYNFKIGVIARPLSFLRLGLSVHTPTYYTLENSHYASIDYNLPNNTGNKSGSNETPEASNRYGYRTPLKVQAGVGFVLGKAAIISVDYRYTDRNTMRFGSSSSYSTDFEDGTYDDDNDDIKKYAKATHQVRLGAEVKIKEVFALRAGTAYTTPSCSGDAQRLLPLNTTRTDLEYTRPDNKFGALYASAGFGFRHNGFAVDVAYAYRLRKEQFMPYQADFEPATLKTHSHNVLATFSWRF